MESLVCRSSLATHAFPISRTLLKVPHSRNCCSRCTDQRHRRSSVAQSSGSKVGLVRISIAPPSSTAPLLSKGVLLAGESLALVSRSLPVIVLLQLLGETRE